MKNYTKLIILVLLLSCYTLVLIRPVKLYETDIGRLIKNGEIILASFSEQIKSTSNIFNSNYYSYAYPNTEFINHHWAAGIIFYKIWLLFNFTGLHLFTIFINLFSFLIFFYIAYKKSNFVIATTTAFILMPLLATRPEIRPEIFSYLFLGVYLFILFGIRDKNIPFRYIYTLPLIMIFWVNLHIFFIFGFFLLFIFIIDDCLRNSGWKKNIKKYYLVIFLLFLAGGLNPNGFKGLLYPLRIFENYGVTVLENIPPYLVFKQGLLSWVVIALFFLTFIFYLITFLSIAKSDKRKFFLEFSLFFTFGFLAWLMTRALILYALFSLPLIAWIISYKQLPINKIKIGIQHKKIIFILIILIFLNISQRILNDLKSLKLGLLPGESDVADYIINNNIQGNLFNDFNSGGYVIYYLYPHIKPFVDNRPEAYPKNFFENTYYKIFEENDEELKWKEISQKYDINIIMLSKRKLSQKFIERRINDPNWNLIMMKNTTMLFIKNNKTMQK